MRRVTISSVAVEKTLVERKRSRHVHGKFASPRSAPSVGRHYPTLCRHYQCCLGFISSELSARPQP